MNSILAILQNMLQEENFYHELGKLKVQKIEENIIKLEHSEKTSKEEKIDVVFSNISIIVSEWKKQFLKELEDTTTVQKELLLLQKSKIQDIMAQLTKSLYNSKVKMNICCSSERETTAEICLKELKPIISSLQDVEELAEAEPVHFVVNENMVNSCFGQDGRHKLAYIELFPLNFSNFKLECTDVEMRVGGKVLCTIHVSDEYESQKIYYYLEHSVILNETDICPSKINICKKFIQIKFVMADQGSYAVRCAIFNQHISGSPLIVNTVSGSVSQESGTAALSHQMTPVEINGREPDSATTSLYFSDNRQSVSQNLVLPSSQLLTPPVNAVSDLQVGLTPSSSVLTKPSLSLSSNKECNPLPRSGFAPATQQPGQLTTVTPGSYTLASSSTMPQTSTIKPQTLSPMKACLVQRIQKKVLRRPLRASTKGDERAVQTSIPAKDFEKCDEILSVREPLRRPAIVGTGLNVQVNSLSEEVGRVRLDDDIEFNPSLASTADQKSLEERLKSAYDTTINSSADLSLHPGSKTILFEEVFKVGNLDMNANHSLPKNGTSQNDEHHYDKKLTSSLYDEPPSLMNDHSMDLDMSKTIKFFQMELMAKYESLFRGNTEVTLHYPIGVAQLKSEEIVVADTFADRLLLFSRDGSFIRHLSPLPSMRQPSAIVVLPDGRFAVRDCRSLSTFSPTCQPIASFGSDILKKPYGITTDSCGNLVTIDIDYDNSMSIVRIDSHTGKLLRRVPVINHLSVRSQKLSKARFITFHPPSSLLIVDLGLDIVYIVDIDTGEVMKKFGANGTGDGEFRDPTGVVCDADGFILIGDSRNHRIQIFTPDGEFVSVLKVDRPLDRPSGIYLTKSSHLFVLNYWEHSLVKYRLCLKDTVVH